MVRNAISDAVARIKNGYAARLDEVFIPRSKKVKAVMETLVKHKYLQSVKEAEGRLTAELNYRNKEPAVMGIRNVSVPGKKVYASYKKLPKVWGGLGINILSTSKGIMSDKEARKLKLGGEILLQVW